MALDVERLKLIADELGYEAQVMVRQYVGANVEWPTREQFAAKFLEVLKQRREA